MILQKYLKFSVLVVGFLYSTVSFAHKGAPPPVAPGTPTSVKFWESPENKYTKEVEKIFGHRFDRYRYFVQVATNIDAKTKDKNRQYYTVAPDSQVFSADDFRVFENIVFADLKPKKVSKATQKINRFLATNYKTQILPGRIYENDKHLPRPFYLQELRDWSFDAILNNDIDKLRALLDNYSLLNVKNEDGYGLLSYAVLRNRTDIARFLISRGANLNETNRYQEIPLAIAAKNNNFEMVKILAHSGSDITYKSIYGSSSIDYAKNNDSQEIYEYLLALGKK